MDPRPVDPVWRSDNDDRTLADLLTARLERDPDGEYLDVVGTKLSAADVFRGGGAVAAMLRRAWASPGDRVATLVENSAEAVLAWWGIVDRAAASPCRSTPPTRASTCATSWPTPAPGCCSSSRRCSTAPSVVVGDVRDARARRGASVTPRRSRPTDRRTWYDLLAPTRPTRRRVRPSDLGDVRLHRRHDRPVEGLHAQPQLPRTRWPDRSASAGVAPRTTWSGRRCRCSTSTRSSPRCSARSSFGGRSAIYRRFSVSQLLARDEPRRARRSPRPSARWRTCWPTTATDPRCRDPARPRPTRRCG